MINSDEAQNECNLKVEKAQVQIPAHVPKPARAQDPKPAQQNQTALKEDKAQAHNPCSQVFPSTVNGRPALNKNEKKDSIWKDRLRSRHKM